MTADRNDKFGSADNGTVADRMIDEALADMRIADAAPDDAFRSLALAGFDAFARARRKRLSLDLFADAFGWRALARPLAAASLLLTFGAAGVIAGAATPEADNALYAELSDAFDQDYGFVEEYVP
ncbi:MAG: hypothetical protein KDE05_02645 [Parvularculaceae bacterium]|nr:hypothetical protein [Parvularculaceae bacterium]